MKKRAKAAPARAGKSAARTGGKKRARATSPAALRRLRERLRETEETLDALRTGTLDAIVVDGPRGRQIYSLAGAEQPYRVYVEQMQEGAVTVAADGVILYCNRRFAEMIGRPLERVISSALGDLLPGGTWAELAGAFAGNGAVKHESLLRAADGRERPVRLTGSRLPSEESAVMCLMVTDLTEQKEQRDLQLAKEVAEKANFAKDAFLAALSHELRTPLTPVLMAVEALEKDPSFPAVFRRQFSMIRRNVELEARLIDDLLDLTRIARGKLELVAAPLDLRAVVDLTLDICRPEIEARRQILDLSLDALQTQTTGDAVRLQQALWNLIRNASKFTSPHGRIRVSTANPAPDRFRLEVQDSGIGFAAETAQRLFTAFEQGGRQITRRFGGLGLGLAITRSIVEGHGGTVQASSPGLGQGATFAVELPLHPVPLAERAPAGRPPAPAAGRALKLLFVEDHADTRLSLQLLLAHQGHEVLAVGSAEEALEAAAGERFDAVLSDLGLPDRSGLELMRELRDRFGLTGVAMSGYGMEEDVAKSRAAGFSQHLTKPIGLEQLRRVLRELGAAP